MMQNPFTAAAGGNGSRAYLCLNCSLAVSYSDRLVTVSGLKRHSFTNPAGVLCEFFTFSSCPGAATFGYPTEEYSWFSGYGWSLALCRQCGNHLGWHYRQSSDSEQLPEFWGILINQIQPYPG